MPEYYNVTTNLGDAEIANAIATNTKLNITHIAFGDGNGSVPTPNKARTSLVREVHRQAVTKYERHVTNSNWIVIETIIPSGVGGFTIREMGIIANGKLISHGSHAPFEKVADPSGVSEYRLRFTQNVTDGSVVELTLDQSLIYATQAWIDDNFIHHDDIIDNSTTPDPKKPVSANQAKIFKDALDVAISDLDVLLYSPIPYSKLIPPNGFLAMMGQDIVQSIHPKLYSIYGAKLPDLRAYTIRGLDHGRGIDIGREILSEQGDAIRNITGGAPGGSDAKVPASSYTGAFSLSGKPAGRISTGENWGLLTANFDASRVVPTANENRVKTIAFLYIVKAG